ncbi:vascular endothelial growth factor receptor kdr-like isoform X2 [Macrobrachium rosenbergii]|uniref:vascular endothelial growth factor receptor kdr-like isoform X2 n=1 Tax=Macrobrachium rosenbergii TaxID=79674 RepID=UPI0034D75B48
MYYTSYLRVPNVTLEDSGTYNCTVNIEGRSPLPATRDINIKENENPFLTVSTDTQNITCSTGEDVFWKLEVASFPPSFTLQSNSKIDHRQYPNGTCILEKKRATPSDFGEHTVTVTTNTSLGVKTEQVSLYLEVKSETELKITGINATTRPNATITLSCNAIGYPMENITWHYQSCPDGVCPESFREPEGSEITYAVHKGNHHSSECTFVAKEFARIRCRSGKKEEFANIVVSEFAESFSFKYSGTGGMKDLLTTSNYTSIETDSFALTCAASRFTFSSVNLTFSHSGKGVSSGDYTVPVVKISKVGDFDMIATLDVANVSSRDDGTYKCTGLRKTGDQSREMTLYHKVDALIPVVLEGTGNMRPNDHKEERMVRHAFTFSCSVSGTPPIDITWTKDDQPLPSNFGELGEDNQTITIAHLDPIIHSGRFVCEPRNRAGSVRGFLTLTVRGEGPSKTIIVIVSVCAVFLVCLLVVVLALFRRVRRDFLKRQETKKNLAFLFERGRPNELNPDCTADEQAELLPYDHKWEVSKDQIQLGQQLGTGAFGRVVKATVSNLEPGVSKTVVALKMCKMQGDATQIMSLTQELKIMIHIGKHLNIVNLMGSCTANVSKGELWILVEYCQHGSLLQFLHCNQHNFENVIDPVTDLISLSGRDGSESVAPFSPVVKSPAPFKSSSDPQSPPRSKKECYESAQTASPAMSTGRRKCDILLESPASPKVLYSSSDISNEDLRDGECQASSPRIVQCGNFLTNRMEMVHNPSYQMVPAAKEAVLEKGNHSNKQQSLKVCDSQGNYFMYDNSTIPGVTSSFTTVDLICWSWQVAEGMDYLTRRKVLHGDLAARNLLLAEANVVKISDFGLSRDIYQDDVYFKRTGNPLPVKWLSIEAIRKKIFSVQSDIWSFGVTLWELFSLGSTPYPGVQFDNTFLLSLENGYRMEKPEYANTDLYKIMCQCWESVPQDRPSFRHLANRLSKMLMPETTQYYNIKNGEYLNMNKERFKHETDYLEMLASPDIRCITRDGVSQNEVHF